MYWGGGVGGWMAWNNYQWLEAKGYSFLCMACVLATESLNTPKYGKNTFKNELATQRLKQVQ